uniref:Uncharacterized protein n=1 Tax=candidate division WOR-3 bacterium TaxID=2052148 RepID=A0A7V0Z6U2_UNCW3
MWRFKEKQIFAIIFVWFNLSLPIAWERNYGTEVNDAGIAVDEVNSWYILGGTTIYSDNHIDAYLTCIENDGTPFWGYTYGCAESLEILSSYLQNSLGKIWPNWK